MLELLAQTLPFFALIGLGWVAAWTGNFGAEATAALTRFVFYYALSALIFRFTAGLDLGSVFDRAFLLAYVLASVSIYLLATLVAWARGRPMMEAAVEAQCAVVGNMAFLGIPILTLVLGEAAIGPILQVLVIDLVLFGGLIVALLTGGREGRVSARAVAAVAVGFARNPMIVSIAVGLAWAASGMTIPVPLQRFVDTLGAAATPGALFAIGASLAAKSAERLSVAAWLSTCKLVLHPAAVAVTAFLIFDVAPFAAGVMVACAALPVANNVYILAQTYAVAPQRAAASILLSTILSMGTLTVVLALIGGP